MRTEIGLKTAERKIAELKDELPHLKAANPHELVRGLETENLVTVGEIMAKAAQVRRESRFIPYHYRLDYPETQRRRLEWADRGPKIGRRRHHRVPAVWRMKTPWPIS